MKLASTVPVFLVRDVQASAAWYRDHLGFAYARFYGEPPGFVILHRDRIEIMLRQCPSGVRPISQALDGMWDAYVRLDDLEAFQAELTGRGTPIRRGPERMFYDCTEIEVADPDGYAICFAACD